MPLDLPGSDPAPSYDDRAVAAPVDEAPEIDGAEVETDPTEAADLAAAFPGLANRSTPSTVDVDDEELAKQLATLSPRAPPAPSGRRRRPPRTRSATPPSTRSTTRTSP